MYDDHDVLRQGGGDGGAPPDEDRFGPGPEIESIHTGPADLPVPDDDVDDPIEVPVPDGDTDIDIDDDDFWTCWMDEVRADEYYPVERRFSTLSKTSPAQVVSHFLVQLAQALQSHRLFHQSKHSRRPGNNLGHNLCCRSRAIHRRYHTKLDHTHLSLCCWTCRCHSWVSLKKVHVMCK